MKSYLLIRGLTCRMAELGPNLGGHRAEPRLIGAVDTAMAEPNGGDVFLLGAGFARAITSTMPLLQDLAERIERSLAEEHGLPDVVRGMMAENFAHALSYLEQAKPWVTEADNLRHRALFLDISNAIARDLDATVTQAGDALGRNAPGWLRELIEHWHAHRSTVVTLNYDTLIETVAATLAHDGNRLTAHDIYPPVLTDAGLRTGGGIATARRDSFRLLKLHGSTNWYYSGRALSHGEPIYFVPPLPADADAPVRREHEQRMRAVADKYPFLVPPIYDKSPLLTHETIRALWFEAGEALKRAERIVCMGYSLPESDLTMKHFLRTTCAADGRLEIVNPAATSLENFRRLFRGTGVRIEQRARGPECIAEFVARGLRGGDAGRT